jgi:parallel beta-helix repeat protein
MNVKSLQTYANLLLAATWIVSIAPARAGELEPTAPPGHTMKTLDEVEPRIPIHTEDLPLTITEPNSYYFTENIKFSPEPNMAAITVESDHVTIDLMGYSLIGPGFDTVSGYGVLMDMRNNVEIRNGTIQGFGQDGIYETNYSDDGSGHRVINVRLVYNGGWGVHLKGPGNLIKDCYVVYNQSGGVAVGDDWEGRGYSIITGNVVMGNAGAGILAVYGCIIAQNNVSRNAANGISAREECVITENKTYVNRGNGIQVNSGCTVTNNTCENNGWIMFDGAGIYVTDSNNRIERNVIKGNDRGLDIDASENIVTANTVKRNTDNYDIAAGNQLNILLCEIPETIDWPATVTLAGTLSCSQWVDGILVTADDVTIDLAGHALIGPGAGNCNGIAVAEGATAHNLKVMDGKIRDWDLDGVRGHVNMAMPEMDAFSPNCLLMNLQAFNNGATGLNITQGKVTNCTSCDNGDRGISVADGSTVIGCTASGNGGVGIEAQNGCVIRDCTSRSNGTCGIVAADGTLIKNCCSTQNQSHGIGSGYRGLIIGNNCEENGLSGTGSGIYLCIPYSGCRIEDNNVNLNVKGIEVNSPGNIIIKNTAQGNTGSGTPSANYDVAAGNALGQILNFTAGGTITSSNPWANFEF